jgi:hypothetical protein
MKIRFFGHFWVKTGGKTYHFCSGVLFTGGFSRQKGSKRLKMVFLTTD